MPSPIVENEIPSSSAAKDTTDVHEKSITTQRTTEIKRLKFFFMLITSNIGIQENYIKFVFISQ